MYRKGQKTIGNVYEEVGMPPGSQAHDFRPHMLANPSHSCTEVMCI